MATIHRTTMSPAKLELLTVWLPSRKWYAGPAHPTLGKAGGFRLDDPAGAVGIEFMIVTAVGDGSVRTYHVPMTYRRAPLPDGDDALIGTAMHGVLGRRWICDGPRDPVFAAELTRLLSGATVPQQQSRSDETDPSIEVTTTSDPQLAAAARVVRVLDTESSGGVPCVRAPWVAVDGAACLSVVVTG